MAHCSGPALRGYNDLSSHVAQGLQEGVFLSLVDLVKHLPVHSCSLQPGSMGPGGSRRPMANSSTNSTHHLQVGAWSQTGAGNKPSYLADHLAAASGSKGWYFKMEQEFWALPFFFFFLSCWGWLGFVWVLQERWALSQGVPPFYQIVHHPDKNFPTFSPAFASRVCLLVAAGSQTPFLFSNNKFFSLDDSKSGSDFNKNTDC